MNIAGIVCEYNPMHKSHEYHIAKTRELLGPDCGIICVMSGNFVQRGDFAVMNKFARARAAVLCGADLVIELPVPWCVSTAEKFATGAVSILDNIGVCTHISFGSETGELEPLREIANYLLDPEIDGLIKDGLKKGVSYAAARQRALENLMGRKVPELSSPNDILAIEYLKALETLESDINPLAVKREGAEHDSDYDDEFVSASFLREKLFLGENIDSYISDGARSVINEEISSGRCPVSMKNCDTAVMARLRSMTDSEYASLPDGSEGLYMRLKSAAYSETCAADVLEKVHTKRYPYSRVRRMILCAYLGVRSDDADGIPPYARVLAMNKTGQSILSKMKKVSSIPVITKPSRVRGLDEDCRYIFDMGSRATDLYTLAYSDPEQRKGYTDYTTSPFVL